MVGDALLKKFHGEKVPFDAEKNFLAIKTIDKTMKKISDWALAAARPLVLTMVFCGTMVLNDLSGVAYADGVYTVNSAKPLMGPVSDLSVIGRMPYLNKLSLIMQPVESLASLERLVLLNGLSLAGCEHVNLSTLPPLSSLSVLHLEHSNVRDLSALNTQPALKTVTVSIEMLPLIFSDDAAFDIVLVP